MVVYFFSKSTNLDTSMPAAPIPPTDEERLRALARYNILDSDEEEVLDRITRLAKSMFRTPIALISIIDKERQWFKSRIGLAPCETHRDQAFCGYAILQSDMLVVEDATKDLRFFDNPLVTNDPNIRFYAGAQLVTHDDHALGTLCIIDRSPRQFLDVDKQLLRELAMIAMNEIELRVANMTRKQQAQFVNRDITTNTYNLNTFKKLFNAECERSRYRKTALSLAIFRLNGLDAIASSVADGVVDAVAQEFRDACKFAMRPRDIIARVGRDAVALLMPNTRIESAEIIARRIIKNIEAKPLRASNVNKSCSVTAGIAQMSSSQKAVDFYKEAESNQLAARNSGQNTYVASFVA